MPKKGEQTKKQESVRTESASRTKSASRTNDDVNIIEEWKQKQLKRVDEPDEDEQVVEQEDELGSRCEQEIVYEEDEEEEENKPENNNKPTELELLKEELKRLKLEREEEKKEKAERKKKKEAEKEEYGLKIKKQEDLIKELFDDYQSRHNRKRDLETNLWSKKEVLKNAVRF
jgi:hypothetical protein